ncbi:MAG TPA: dihydroxyacetone kinase subunit L [Firmicutes bacterium]|nr:dihydroxyacetone kinase subunit L [Bacillota bacterium]
MDVTLTGKDFISILNEIADAIEKNQDYLSELDSALGDGDHGVSMTIGWRAVKEKLPELAGKDIGTILKTVGMTLVSSVGAAMGPLYGTGFMRAGMAVDGKQEVTGSDLVKMFVAFREGVVARGKANVGDKTMVDTIHPAVEAFKTAMEGGEDVYSALDKAVAAGEAGMKSTINLVSKMGRSSRLGERTIGHQDPGATSSYIMLKTFADAVKRHRG